MSTATTKARVRSLEDGPSGNQRTVHALMLEIHVAGVERHIEVRMATFDPEYGAIAKEFCEWFNAKGHAMMGAST